MAKAKNTKTVRERAIALWVKATGFMPDTVVQVYKSRKHKMIAVAYPNGTHKHMWTYKGGTLRRIA